MKIKYTCGADVTFKGENKYAVDSMGLFDTVEEAVIARKKLHPAFPQVIYAVESKVVKGLERGFGILQGNECAGFKVLHKECDAYEHPAWNLGDSK